MNFRGPVLARQIPSEPVSCNTSNGCNYEPASILKLCIVRMSQSDAEQASLIHALQMWSSVHRPISQFARHQFVYSQGKCYAYSPFAYRYIPLSGRTQGYISSLSPTILTANDGPHHASGGSSREGPRRRLGLQPECCRVGGCTCRQSGCTRYSSLNEKSLDAPVLRPALGR